MAAIRWWLPERCGQTTVCLFFNHADAIATLPGKATATLLFYPQNLWVSFKKNNFYIKTMLISSQPAQDALFST